ncbi:hypothetical protein N7494_006688 [Penicillium frequentans]|uniref:Uncharacterized protein n=1 Tax=Penicillium frequentans TaxID=3151616 RepID=A0AAD6CWY3_9EURO|nr:hypothetical protein N7494_006688 [Penicillium glabrum]
MSDAPNLHDSQCCSTLFPVQHRKDVFDLLSPHITTVTTYDTARNVVSSPTRFNYSRTSKWPASGEIL